MQTSFHSIAPSRDINLFIFGDHASNYIPPQYDNLGLSGDDLTRHIAWDLGTDVIVRALCAHFGCAGQLAAVSRLVIDINREPERDTLIPPESDGTQIIANQNLTPEQRQARIDAHYAPYHAALGKQLASMEDPLVLSVHSFTPQVRGQAPRDVEIGLLMRHDEATAHAFMARMKAAHDYNIQINEPYSAYDLNYTIDHHLAPRGLRHLAIEIRQDHVDTDDKAAAMADALAPILAGLI